MRERRNPFFLRAAENIEAEDTFVHLYNPDFLDILDGRNIWGKPFIIRGAPGDGKTSLLHLFTPQLLLALSESDRSSFSKELFRKLKGLGAINDIRPLVIGSYLSCAKNYHVLEDLEISDVRKQRLFFSLLNCRIALSFLLSISQIKDLQYPKDLKRISFNLNSTPSSLNELTQNFDGQELHDWAVKIETNIGDALDSFAPLSDVILPGHISLDIIEIFRPNSIKIDDEIVSEKILFMLDDVQVLTSRQRALLYKEITTIRPSASLWLSERLEALDTADLLASGSKLGRDYDSTVNIGEFFRRRQHLEKFSTDITNRRVQTSSIGEHIILREALSSSLVEINPKRELRVIETDLIDRLYNSHPHYFDLAMRENESLDDTFDRIINFRSAEILSARDDRRMQRPLFDIEIAFPVATRQIDNSTRHAAEYLLSQEFNLPYYYGFSRLSILSFSNIEQLLWLSGELFEEILAARLVGKTAKLRADHQQRILKKVISRQWNELQPSVGRDVRNLIQAIGRYSHEMSTRPNAPYAPGVTGIAISMQDRDLLGDPNFLNRRPEFRRLAQTLTRAVAHNHLQPHTEGKSKGQDWFKLYLNRIWCVQFDLPLGYGGWKEQKLTTLLEWIETGGSIKRTRRK